MFKVGTSEVLDSIAILPIINESGDPEQDSFAIGVTQELITRLFKVGALEVVPLDQVRSYLNSEKSSAEISSEFGAKAIVEDIIYLEAECAQAIVSELKVAIQPKERTLLASGSKVNPEAYNLVMQGIDFWLYHANGLGFY